MTFFDDAMHMLIEDEGWRNYPYVDTTGHTTIGVGHNLTDKGISDDIIRMILLEDIGETIVSCERIFGSYWHSFKHSTRLACINLVFNLGEAGFRKWKNTIAAIKLGDIDTVCTIIDSSLWKKQVKDKRANKVKELFRRGKEEL